ncbi:MAG: hypothetical protein J5562_00545 [Clostridia bacterium]|nr:hypothetical protein [Clostridia bacterium]
MKKSSKFIAVLLALVFVFSAAMPAVTAFAANSAAYVVTADEETTPTDPGNDPENPENPENPEDPAQDEPELNAVQKFLINILEKIGNFLGGGKSGGAPKFIAWLIGIISGQKSTQLIPS